MEKAGRFGADVATVGGMVQLVTRGILLHTMRVDSSDEEIDIHLRLPEADRLLATLDGLKLRTRDGLVPLSNFVTREPVAKPGRIDQVDQRRHYDVKADGCPVWWPGMAARSTRTNALRPSPTGCKPTGRCRPALPGKGRATRRSKSNPAPFRPVPLPRRLG